MADHPPIEDLVAASQFVDAMVARADGRCGAYPWWYGWALREAYLAGRRDERATQAVAAAVDAVYARGEEES